MVTEKRTADLLQTSHTSLADVVAREDEGVSNCSSGRRINNPTYKYLADNKGLPMDLYQRIPYRKIG